MITKKFLLAFCALSLSVAAFSQTDTTRKDTSGTRKDSTQKRDTTALMNQSEKSVISGTNGSVSGTTQTNGGSNSGATQSTNANAAGTASWPNQSGSSNTSATNQNTTSASASTNVPKPNFGRYYIPVLGSYSSSEGSVDSKSVTITPDENNAGKIWIEGLTQSRFYALLKSAPGTYKIPSQKQDQYAVSEGTLTYDDNSKQVNICVGCGYNEANMSAVADEKSPAGKTKTRKSVISFSGTKKDQGTASISQ